MESPNSLVYLSQKTFVFNREGKFLTLLRTESAPSRPLTWDLPGGSFEMGESPREGALREIREETGIQVEDIKPVAVESDRNKAGEFWVSIAYRAMAVTANVQLSFEHKDYRWVTPEEFLTLESSEKWQRIVRENLL